jgi:hypothetical protein
MVSPRYPSISISAADPGETMRQRKQRIIPVVRGE